mmetsp:Transcript_73389/g.192423  ORF Transcript_73389/g.192423 Transcript_73389/m.192423 type:complete len:670 (-) Transcript_73389:24-2033(-)
MRRSLCGLPLVVGALFDLACCVEAAWRPPARGREATLRERIALAQTQIASAHQGRNPVKFQSEDEVSSKPGAPGGHAALYPVTVNLDIQEMRISEGLTMIFEKRHSRLRLDHGIEPMHGLAWGHFDDNIESSGWSELYVETASSDLVSNDIRMYSAGFIEGLLTCVRISEFNANAKELLRKNEARTHALEAVMDKFRKELAYMKEKVNLEQHVLADEPTDPYLKHVRYMLVQLWGVCDGYNLAAKRYGVHTLHLEDLVLLNSGGELPQLMEAYTPDAMAQRAPLSFLQRGRGRTAPPAAPKAAANASVEDPLDDAHWEKRIVNDGRCSALVRLTEGNDDLLLGHTTWDDYSKMTRIFKYYKFNLKASETMATNIAFSSYPGVISSTDDFYLMDSGLAVMETSLEILDLAAWDNVQDFPASPQIPGFVHLMAVNRLAKSPVHWVQMMMKVNTGTYASQWMVVDYSMFRSGMALPDNAFWVLEQMPGVQHAEDMSPYLRKHGYFPSFNRPYFDPIRDASGHKAAELRHGALYSWKKNARALIFAGAMASPSVNSLADMRVLMDRNLYPNSGAAPVEPGHEISARMDLGIAFRIPNGGIDSKVVGRCLASIMNVQAISGPSHQTLSPFRWRGEDGGEVWPGWPHVGQPNVWNFNYVQMTPTVVQPVLDPPGC